LRLKAYRVIKRSSRSEKNHPLRWFLTSWSADYFLEKARLSEINRRRPWFICR